MQIPSFTLERQYFQIGSEIEESVIRVLKGGYFIGGEEVRRFEESFASLIGVNSCISCNSGTDALVLALRALNIGEGDEVITTSFSFFATSEAISIVGATPVFADINPNTYLINTNLIESLITSRTKAIMPVHLFGNAVNMSALKLIAEKHNLKIIEDCAQATCSKWGNLNVGSLGDIGCFSFFPTKNLGAAGDGGAVTTSDPVLAQNIRELAVHGSPKRYIHTKLGYNSRMDAIQAAVLNIKLNWISKWVQKRNQIAENYFNLIKKNEFLSLPEINSDLTFHSWNQFVIKLDNKNFSSKKIFVDLFETDLSKLNSLRNLIKMSLSKKGINSIIYYPIPIHAQLAYKDRLFNRANLLKTEKICTEVLSLPIFPEITYDEQVYVAENLNLIMSEYIRNFQISA